MAELLEVCMVVCFGISWPVSIYKSVKARTARGKSLVFLLFIWVGYVFGVTAKFAGGNLTYVVVFYIINLAAVSVDLGLYFRNRRLDRMAEV